MSIRKNTYFISKHQMPNIYIVTYFTSIAKRADLVVREAGETVEPDYSYHRLKPAATKLPPCWGGGVSDKVTPPLTNSLLIQNYQCSNNPRYPAGKG